MFLGFDDSILDNLERMRKFLNENQNNNKDGIDVAVISCARCGKNHESLKITKITNPIPIKDGKMADYWSMCPELDEPLLFVVTNNIKGK